MFGKLCALLGAAVMVAAAALEPAAAASVPRHLPIGHLDSVRASGMAGPGVPTGWNSGSYVSASGWSFDPDAKATSEIVGIYDGSVLQWRHHTSAYRPDVNRVHRLTGRHGYAARYAVANGVHRICALQENIGAGRSSWSHCAVVNVNGSPYGAFESLAAAAPATVHVTGWAADPDDTRLSGRVSYTIDGVAPGNGMYIDGVLYNSRAADGARPDVNNAVHIPGDHGFSFDLSWPNAGPHTVCIVALNYGPPAPDTNLGCKTITLPSHWSQSAPPYPPGNPATAPYNVTLNNLACPAVETCFATGFFGNKPSSGPGFIDSLSGSTWTEHSVALPAGADPNSGYFSGIACGGGTDCAAVGQANQLGNTGFIYGVTDTLANGTWSTSLSRPMASIACPAPGSCVAVGGLLIRVLNNGTWTETNAPRPADFDTAYPYGFLTEVSCVSSTQCVAVGEYRSTSGPERGLVVTLSGTTWSAAALPMPANAPSTNVGFDHVACNASLACVASGHYELPASGPYRLVLDSLSGGQWTSAPAPMPSDFDPSGVTNFIGSMSCDPAGLCAAVGAYAAGQSWTAGLIEVYDNGTWTAQRAPEPPDAWRGSRSLTAVQCPALGFCVAVGAYPNMAVAQSSSYVSRPNAGAPLSESLRNGAWTAEALPLPNNAPVALQALDCVGPTWCEAVGSNALSAGATAPVAYTWSG